MAVLVLKCREELTEVLIFKLSFEWRKKQKVLEEHFEQKAQQVQKPLRKARIACNEIILEELG